jgi:hypothetical protein
VLRLLRVAGLAGPSSDDLAFEGLRLELARLGLLGRRFTWREYLAALEERLGIDIEVTEYPDLSQGVLDDLDEPEDLLAEVNYRPDERRAVIVVRESLRLRPWPAFELSVFHELSHLAAGHHLLLRRTARSPLGRLGRLGEEDLESEARRRARWLLLAGLEPEAFAGRMRDRVV